MIIYRIKHKEHNVICASLYDKRQALDRLNEANQGVYRRFGWPKGEYLIEIFELGQESFDNENIF